MTPLACTCIICRHIDFCNFRPEDQEADEDTMYSLHCHYGPVCLTGDTGVTRKRYFRNMDELIEGVKGMRENEMIKSFFV